MPALVINSRRRGAAVGHPIDHDVGQELVTGKDAFDIACTIAPSPKFFDDPSCESNGRIIQAVTQGLRLGCLLMAVAAFGIPTRAELSEIGTRNLILRLYVQRASEQKTPRDPSIIFNGLEQFLFMFLAHARQNANLALTGEVLHAFEIRNFVRAPD